MKKVSELIKVFLTSNPLFNAVIGGEKVFPLVAPNGTLEPFATYVISQKRNSSKDSKIFEVTLLFWFKNYDPAVEFADGLEPFIEESKNLHFQDSTVEYLEEYQSYSSIINLQIIN